MLISSYLAEVCELISVLSMWIVVTIDRSCEWLYDLQYAFTLFLIFVIACTAQTCGHLPDS